MKTFLPVAATTGQVLSQVIRSLQITPSGLIVHYRYTTEINMLDSFDAWITQSPIINNLRHWCFPRSLIICFFEKCRTDDQGFFMVKQWYTTLGFPVPTYRR